MSELQREAVRMISGQAFKRLDAARAEIRRYLPDDFEPERELEEARAERYGNDFMINYR